jgi:hypothetical protein
MDNVLGDFNTAAFAGVTGSGSNMTSDATAPGANPLINKLAVNQFINVATFNFLLLPSSDAVGAGARLTPAGETTEYSLDVLSFERANIFPPAIPLAGLAWDIGAEQKNHTPSTPSTIVTIGPGGPPTYDYADLATFAVDLLAGSSAVPSACEVEVTGVTTVVGLVALVAGPGITSVTIRPAAGAGHTGKVNTGQDFQCSVGGRVEIQPGGASPGCVFTLEGLQFSSSTTSPASLSIADADGDVTIRRCIFVGLNTVAAPTLSMVDISCLFAIGSVNFTNNMIVNYSDSGCLAAYGLHFQIPAPPFGTPTHNIANNTVYGLDTSGIVYDDMMGFPTITMNIQNNISMGATVDYQNTGFIPPALFTNNLSEDTTGTAGLINKLPANQFVNSTSTAASVDLLLISGADAIDVGVNLGTTSEVNLDIVDYDRNIGLADWDIGANEFVSVGPNQITRNITDGLSLGETFSCTGGTITLNFTDELKLADVLSGLPVPPATGGEPGRKPKPQSPAINWSHPLARGLAAVWPFTEGGGDTLHDIVGGGNGTINGSPAWYPSPAGQSMLFDKVDDYVSVPSNSANNFTKNWTISFWRRRGPNPEHGGAMINKVNPVGYSGSYQGANYKQYAIRGGNSVTLDYEYNGNNWDVQTAADVIPDDNSWNLITVTMSPALLATIYINGVYSTSDTAPAEVLALDYDLQFGKLTYVPGNNFFGGRINDIRMWNRCLTASEVLNLFVDPWALYKPECPIIPSYYRASIAGPIVRNITDGIKISESLVDPDAVFKEECADGLKLAETVSVVVIKEIKIADKIIISEEFLMNSVGLRDCLVLGELFKTNMNNLFDDINYFGTIEDLMVYSALIEEI